MTDPVLAYYHFLCLPLAADKLRMFCHQVENGTRERPAASMTGSCPSTDADCVLAMCSVQFSAGTFPADLWSVWSVPAVVSLVA